MMYLEEILHVLVSSHEFESTSQRGTAETTCACGESTDQRGTEQAMHVE